MWGGPTFVSTLVDLGGAGTDKWLVEYGELIFPFVLTGWDEDEVMLGLAAGIVGCCFKALLVVEDTE